MSVSDVPEVLEKHIELMALAPVVGHGYLFHTTGKSYFLVLAAVAIPYTAFLLNSSYQFEDGKYKGKSARHHRGMKIFERWSFLFLLSSGVVLLIELLVHMNHGDLIHIYLLLANSVFAMMLVLSWYFSNYFERIGPFEEG